MDLSVMQNSCDYHTEWQRSYKCHYFFRQTLVVATVHHICLIHLLREASREYEADEEVSKCRNLCDRLECKPQAVGKGFKAKHPEASEIVVTESDQHDLRPQLSKAVVLLLELNERHDLREVLAERVDEV